MVNNRLFILLGFLIIIILTSSCKTSEERFIIYNMHEHIESFEQGEKLIQAMNKSNISFTIFVGSPEATLLTNRKGFKGYDKNNEEILKLASFYPNKFIPFCTINPRDEDKLEKFKDCVKNGSRGLKLYSGHTLFYDLPLNESSMFPVYKYLEENKITLLFHVNPARNFVREEMESVLQNFPNLKFNCPHFCLSSINETRFRYLMDTYPNLYTDVSYGFFAEDGLKRISRNVSKFIQIFNDYQDRILFGTDMVVTSHKRKTVEWIYNLTMCYRNMLEKHTYKCKVGNDIDGEFNGLGLDKNILIKVYQENPEKLLS